MGEPASVGFSDFQSKEVGPLSQEVQQWRTRCRRRTRGARVSGVDASQHQVSMGAVPLVTANSTPEGKDVGEPESIASPKSWLRAGVGRCP